MAPPPPAVVDTPVQPPARQRPRLVMYHQTTHDRDGRYISMLDLGRRGIAVTHVVLAALHLHADDAQRIHLNDDPLDHARYATLWAEKRALQSRGLRFLCMVGGAAPGSFAADTLGAADAATFEAFYGPLRDALARYGFDGVDLDVEEPMSQAAIARLVDRLRRDFPPGFLVTLAPVAAALVDRSHLSGFSYRELRHRCGDRIDWYNVQFYNGWGAPRELDAVVAAGWPPEKLVVGLLTNEANGAVDPAGGNPAIRPRHLRPFFDTSGDAVTAAAATTTTTTTTTTRDDDHHRNNDDHACPLPCFAALGLGGIFGWEYFNSLPGGTHAPWLWAREATRLLALHRPDPASAAAAAAHLDADLEADDLDHQPRPRSAGAASSADDRDGAAA